jgi:hypothetical protein
MADHLKRSKAALQKLLDEYWALRKKTCECPFVQKKQELRIRFVTVSYMENIARRLGIDPASFLENK